MIAGNTSNKDTLSYRPNKERIVATAFYSGIASLAWYFIHYSEAINLIFEEQDTGSKRHVRVTGATSKASVPNLVPGKVYNIELYGTNSYGETGESTSYRFRMPNT